ncbi:GNA1162 family protein [Achromobacter deleyi]|uniref:GNA1162 family protein n=1 Tax=Achromobacter deleyi TaxID=1353891 RepID=UPI001E4496F3|nr:GNA1162 family protein [Achromobacter deleyi]
MCCAAEGGGLHTALRESRPASIVVLPPLNTSIEPQAAAAVLSQATPRCRTSAMAWRAGQAKRCSAPANRAGCCPGQDRHGTPKNDPKPRPSHRGFR